MKYLYGTFETKLRIKNCQIIVKFWPQNNHWPELIDKDLYVFIANFNFLINSASIKKSIKMVYLLLFDICYNLTRKSKKLTWITQISALK